MSYIEECSKAIDEDIDMLCERLKSLYAGGEKLKENKEE